MAARPQQLIWETLLTYDYLMRALKDEGSSITFAGQADGHQVVDFESTWGSDEQLWKLQVRFDVDRSLLPIAQRLEYRSNARRRRSRFPVR